MNKKIKNISNSGYNVPEGYFESLEDTIMSKLHTETLKAKVEDHGFKMPDTYLSGIEDQVQEKLSPEGGKVVNLFSRRNLLYISGVAAAVLIMFSLFYNKDQTTIEDLDYEMVENYILDQDMSSYEIASLLTEEDFDETSFDIMSETLTDETLEDYLLDNINLEDIIEQ